jgi:hypothetical protein
MNKTKTGLSRAGGNGGDLAGARSEVIIHHSSSICGILSILGCTKFSLMQNQIYINGSPYDQVSRMIQNFTTLYGGKIQKQALKDVCLLLAYDNPRMIRTLLLEQIFLEAELRHQARIQDTLRIRRSAVTKLAATAGGNTGW